MKTKINSSGILRRALFMPLIVGVLLAYSCKSNAQEHDKSEENHVEGKGHDRDDKNHGTEIKGHDNDKATKTIRGEHSRDKNGGGEGEEDGTELGLNETYDVSKHGVRLTLSYDKKSNSFIGEMYNTTNKMIKKARVEVHLSNGTELGPTTSVNLGAGAKKEVVLKATKRSFKGWSTHAEIGNLEHSGEKEGREGHDGENNEHGNGN